MNIFYGTVLLKYIEINIDLNYQFYNKSYRFSFRFIHENKTKAIFGMLEK